MHTPADLKILELRRKNTGYAVPKQSGESLVIAVSDSKPRAVEGKEAWRAKRY
jgi:hypothetical protein